MIFYVLVCYLHLTPQFSMCDYCDACEKLILKLDKMYLLLIHEHEQNKMLENIKKRFGEHPQIVGNGCLRFITRNKQIKGNGWVDSLVTEFF